LLLSNGASSTKENLYGKVNLVDFGLRKQNIFLFTGNLKILSVHFVPPFKDLSMKWSKYFIVFAFK